MYLMVEIPFAPDEQLFTAFTIGTSFFLIYLITGIISSLKFLEDSLQFTLSTKLYLKTYEMVDSKEDVCMVLSHPH